MQQYTCVTKFRVTDHVPSRTLRLQEIILISLICVYLVVQHIYVHIDQSLIKKFGKTTWQGIMVGYCSYPLAYLIYNTRTRHVISSRSVSFDEDGSSDVIGCRQVPHSLAKLFRGRNGRATTMRETSWQDNMPLQAMRVYQRRGRSNHSSRGSKHIPHLKHEAQFDV